MKELLKFRKAYNPNPIDSLKPSDWDKEAKLQDKIVDLTMQLYIGTLNDKIMCLDFMVSLAQMARDETLLKKAMNIMKKLAEETKGEEIKLTYEKRERCLAQWSIKMKSKE